MLRTSKIIALFVMLMISYYSNYCYAESSLFAPTWLKEGVYAEYTFDEGNIDFYNETGLFGLDRLRFVDGGLRWECIDLNETMATLRVTLSYTETTRNGKPSPENKITKFTTETYVNPLSRNVYLLNGTLIGTTRLWLPANPTPDDDIVLWNIPPDKVTLKATPTNVMTPQGGQEAFKISGMEQIGGSFWAFNLICDFDTGVMVQEFSDIPDPTFGELGIMYWSPSTVVFSDTNIDLGPNNNPFDLRAIITIIAVPVATIILFVVVYMRQRKKR